MRQSEQGKEPGQDRARGYGEELWQDGVGAAGWQFPRPAYPACLHGHPATRTTARPPEILNYWIIELLNWVQYIELLNYWTWPASGVPEILNYWIIEPSFNILNYWIIEPNLTYWIIELLNRGTDLLKYWIIEPGSIYWNYWNYWMFVQYIEIIEN